MKMLTATATRSSRMIRPMPPAAFSLMSSTPYSLKAPSIINATGEMIQRKTANAILGAQFRRKARKALAVSISTRRRGLSASAALSVTASLPKSISSFNK